MRSYRVLFITIMVCITLCSCTGVPSVDTVVVTPLSPSPTAVLTPAPTPTPTPTPTPIPTPTPHPHAKYFSEEERAYFGENEWWYTGPNMAVFIEKAFFEEEKCVVFIAEIYTNDHTVPFIGHAGCKLPGDGIKKKPKDIAQEYRAVYAQNGDFFWEEHNDFSGIIIRSGEVFKKKLRRDMLAIYPNGELKAYQKDEITVEELIEDGVKDTFSFGPILLRDGEINQAVEEHELAGRYPRSAVGMVTPGHYIGILVDGRQPGVSIGMRLMRLAEEFKKRGCTVAYNLDGGQSTGMVFLGVALNSHKNDQPFPNQRRVPEVMCLGETELTPYGSFTLEEFATFFEEIDDIPYKERCQ